jgi:hypothetical protein
VLPSFVVALVRADGITIAGVTDGPFVDPMSTGCGFGEVFAKVGCGADTVPSCH